jgi:hypothetical protein
MKLQTLVLSRVLFIAVAIALLVLLCSVNPRPVKSDQVSLKYDPMAELVITGIVEDVQVFQCPWNAGVCTHLALRTEGGPLIVHVAPTAFLASHEFIVAAGDQVRIVGSKVRYRGADALIAREITSRHQTFIFRRPDGKPLWEK